MSRWLLCAALALLGATLVPSPAEARVIVGVGFGGWGYPWGWGWGPGWGVGFGSGYEEPSRIVYVQPSPPTYYYVQPTYVQPYYAAPSQSYYTMPTVAQPTAVVSSSSGAFVDNRGRTCRNFQSTMNGAPVSGTACLQADGTWRTVGP